MKVTLSWLRNHVNVTGTPAELDERLTQLGLEVEGVEVTTGDFAGVVVAQVVTRDKHPNADKLSVCRVNDGTGERQIVCGAQNFQAGDKVPLILPGASLPPKPGDTQPFTIKVGKIRGVESHGMMCSSTELGIDPLAIGLKLEDGLLILPPETRVGQPLAEFLGRSGGDVLFDLEVTPNRPDLNSVVGIARELAAVTGNALCVPDPQPTTTGSEPVDRQVAVRLDAPDLCPRYTARVIRGLRVGPSPDWLRQALEGVGLRSINNVVDVTNFVMLETGQPLHAFDLHRLARGADGRTTVVVRRATEGETFVTLDGQERRLNPEHLLIADAEKGLALAGVMGGLHSGITEGTVDILIESAYFAPTGIRRTSKALGLRTDASYRFERGADIAASDLASRRCAELILKVAGGQLSPGVVDAYPEPKAPRSIELRHAKVNALLGLQLTADEIDGYLLRLGLVREGGSAEGSTTSRFQIPTFRVDLKREADLIEEVARLFGVERIPSTPPRGALGSHPFDQRYDRFAQVRELLSGLGLTEVQGQTLIASSEILSGDPDAWVRLENPLSSEMDCLRPSLIPGILTILSHNQHRKSGDLQVFELGRTFTRTASGLQERWRLAIGLTGLRRPEFWSGADRDAQCDLFDLKGILEDLFERIGLRAVTWTRRPEPTALFIESADLALGGKLVLGELGQVQPTVARRHDLRAPVFLAEIQLETVLDRSNPERSFKALPQFPEVRRDLALILPESISHDAVLNTIRQAKPNHLEKVELFDVFRGKHVAEGHKSVAYAFTYRSAERTLKDDEVSAAQTRIIEALRSKLGAQIRE
ncbi:MAG: phenylalanine--tRNA ligase subunit beta [Limisphaerales bacterium]